MFVDSLTKTASAPQHATPGPGPTDASKVLAKGLGLSKAYAGQKSSFTVDCSKAGRCLGHGRGWRVGNAFGGVAVTSHLGPPALSTLQESILEELGVPLLAPGVRNAGNSLGRGVTLEQARGSE